MDDRASYCIECLRTARTWVPNPSSLDDLLGFCSNDCQQQYEQRHQQPAETTPPVQDPIADSTAPRP